MSLANVRGQRDLFSERYAALVKSTDDAIIDTSLDGTILSWNVGAERMHGFPAEEALGQRLSLIVPADRARETGSLLRSVARGERVDRLETVRTRCDGTRFEVSVTVSGIRDASGGIVGASAIERDISESKRTEALLRSNGATLAEALSLREQAERLSRTGSWILELGDDPSLTCSKECYRVLGVDAATPIEVATFLSLLHPDDRETVVAAMNVALGEHLPYELQHRIVRYDGTVRWLQLWGEAEYNERCEPVRVVGVVQDITDRYAADEARAASERRVRLLADNARDFIFRYALLPEPRFDYVSPASLAITGFTPEELYADPTLTASLVASNHMAQMQSLLRSGRLSEPIDVMVRRKDGTLIWVNQRLTLVRDDSGTLIAVEGISRDITERKRAEEERTYVSLHDSLTGLPNRSLVRELVELARNRARAESRSVIVAALDLDDFTLLNDTHGHDTGDAVLVAVAELLSSATNGQATVARTGSDEFVVIGDDIADDDDAVTFVDRVRDALLQPIGSNGADLFVHARIGVAVGESSATAETLLSNADIALARAKQQHAGSGVEFFNSDMRLQTDKRFALVSDLHQALERNQFELRYQPIVRLADDRIVGVEALIRWQHPKHGLISPAEFIPLAEDTGLIVSIGAWVFDHACMQLRRLIDEHPTLSEFGMSVNMSVKQLRLPGIVNTVTDAMTHAGIEPGRLTIEMTESVFAEDLDTIREVVTQLRLLGVRIAVDDFGTGYSSLAYLKHFSLDTLKIDQTFTDGLGTDPRDAAIVESTLSLARALGLYVVAEGVETPAQLAALRGLDCDAAQGFYFSKPATADELDALLARDLRDREQS